MDRTARYNTPNFVIFLIVFYVISNLGTGDTGVLLDEIANRLHKDERVLQSLKNATYDDRFRLLNQTVVISPQHLAEIPKLALPYDYHETLPFYLNASSSLKGVWQGHGASNASEDFMQGSGMVRVGLDDLLLAVPGASRARLSVTLTSQSGWSTKDLDLEGIHHHESGLLFLSSDRVAADGIYYAPMLANATTYNITHAAAIEVLQRRIDERRPHDVSEAACLYFAACQLHKTTGTPAALALSEAEYAGHTGAQHDALPPVQLGCFVFSEDCGVSAHVQLDGLRDPQLNRRAHTHALWAIAVVLLQLWLTIQQMQQTASPSHLWRISLWTIGLHCLMDGYYAVAFFIVGLAMPALFLPLMTAAFLALLLMTLFGLRYLLLIYRMHRQLVNVAPATPVPVATQPTEATETQTDAADLPTAATVVLPEPPLTEAQIERRDLSSLYVRFYFTLLLLLFFSLQVAYLPQRFRDLCLVLGSLVLNSYWLPQIFRHFKRGHRKSLSFQYILGLSFCRLLPVLYLFCYTDNLFFQPVNTTAALLIASWVWLQVVTLGAQAVFGPRWLVPALLCRSLPAVYDYHAPPGAQDEEALLGHREDDAQAQEAAGEVTCAICMMVIEMPDKSAADAHDATARSTGTRATAAMGGGFGDVLARAAGTWRRGIMWTPCRHVFHSECLETWMQRRLKCPVCRAVLPPA